MRSIIILGDSISQGIGKRKVNYENYLRNFLDNKYNVINLAYTGTTIEYANSLYAEIMKAKPSYAVVFYGNVDAQIRPNIDGKRSNVTKFMPRRYKKNYMLDPRPVYSSKWYRFIPDRLDNMTRFFLKKIVVRFEGTVQWVSLEKFEKEYTKLLVFLRQNGIMPVIVSTTYLDDKYFLGTNSEYEKYNKCLRKMAVKHGCRYVDLYSALKKNVLDDGFNEYYLFDHYHPNDSGYKFIAKMIRDVIAQKDESHGSR